MVRTTESSSPDPLGSTQQNLGIVPPSKGKAGATPKKPLANTSSNVRKQEFYLTTPPSRRTGNASPFKLVAEADNPSSPWRIRVTVQAEQEDTQHNQSSLHNVPVKRLAERMTTTMVPLKDADEQSPAGSKKGRGRSRKSICSPEKKVGTPKQKSASPRKAVSTSIKKSSSETGRQTPTPSKRGRGRPRKSTEGLAEDLELRNGEGGGLADMIGMDHHKSSKTTSTTRARRQGPSKAILPIKSDLHSDSAGLRSGRAHEEEQLDHDSSAIADSTDRLDCLSYLPDPTDEHVEFDSILESEGFSMVSVSSLPSSQIHSSSPLESVLDRDEDTSGLDDPASLNSVPHSISRALSPALFVKENLGESYETYAQKASSPPPISAPSKNPEPVVGRTPSITSPTTTMPPAVKSSIIQRSPRALDKAGDGTPNLVRVVRAGIALQGVLSPQNVRTRSGNTGQEGTSSMLSSAKSPKERLDDLFNGFGAGTRRELRAGLRLGEELARRHQIVPQGIPKYKSEDDVFGREEIRNCSELPRGTGDMGYSLKLPEPSQKPLYPIISNTQLPSPARSEDDSGDDRMSWKIDTPNTCQTTNVQAKPQTRDPEEEWQLEREAVIRQIQAANSSQVIVINSDSEDEYENDEEDDIWQEQAYSSGIVSAPVHDVPAVLLPNHVPQPRRSQLPSPWRRQSEMASTNRVPGNDSELFWQPSRFVDPTDRCEKLPKEENGEDLNPQSSPSTSHPQDVKLSSNDSTFEPESELQITPIKQNIRVTYKVSSAAKPKIPVSSPLGDEEYGETWQRACGETVEIEEQVTQDRAKKMAPSVTQAAKKTSLGGKPAEVSSSKQRETVGFIPHKRVQTPEPTSWLGYLASFVPAWGGATAAMPHRLPNSRSKLPRTGSLEGPLSLYMPWTTDHYSALYFHYAASKEGRKRYVFNAKSASARYLGRIVHYRGWEKPVTKEDVAIVDAFMVDLKARGTSEKARGNWKIDEKVAVFKVFTLWYGGVLRGENEAGIGKIGLAERSEEMWRPDMESWYHEKKE